MVTGAASGIGRGAALRLLQEGCSVVAVDIDEAGLEAMAAEGAEPLAADLAGIKDRGRQQRSTVPPYTPTRQVDPDRI